MYHIILLSILCSYRLFWYTSSSPEKKSRSDSDQSNSTWKSKPSSAIQAMQHDIQSFVKVYHTTSTYLISFDSSYMSWSTLLCSLCCYGSKSRYRMQSGDLSMLPCAMVTQISLCHDAFVSFFILLASHVSIEQEKKIHASAHFKVTAWHVLFYSSKNRLHTMITGSLQEA